MGWEHDSDHFLSLASILVGHRNSLKFRVGIPDLSLLTGQTSIEHRFHFESMITKAQTINSSLQIPQIGQRQPSVKQQ
jgi:hypothetical protein